jgi:PBSX family phage terminase large subunit
MELEPLSPKQAYSIRNATARLNIWHGSVRSGKTLASLIKWADVICNHDGNGELLMVGKTERTLKRNIVMPLIGLLGPGAVDLKAGIGEADILGETVYLVGANDERSEQKIRGGTFAKIYGDELSLWPESFFKMALSRMSVPGAQLFGTTNPDSPLHYLKREFIDRESELNLRAFHFKLRDNHTLGAEYLDALEREYTGLWRKRFIDGLWVLAEGVIWDVFDADRHAIDALPEGLELCRYYVGIDYGTANPFVALLIGVSQDGRHYVLDEWRWDSGERGRQLTDAQYSSALGEWIEGHGIAPSAWYVDPSAASFILQLRYDHDWEVVPADNDVDDGLRHVATQISDDRLRVVRPRCEGLLAEMASYSWDPRAQERGEDKPIKKADHGPDALRYAEFADAKSDIGDIEQYGWVA